MSFGLHAIGVRPDGVNVHTVSPRDKKKGVLSPAEIFQKPKLVLVKGVSSAPARLGRVVHTVKYLKSCHHPLDLTLCAFLPLVSGGIQ